MEGWHDPDLAASWDAAAADSPGRERQLELLLSVLEAVGPSSILEVGVGSGLVAERVLELLPAVHVVGIDFSAAMLDLARVRLAPFGERVLLLEGDLRKAAELELPDIVFDAAYSVQALHHLDDESKARTFHWLGEVLPSGALFALRDKVAVPPELFDAYATVWRAQGVEMPPSATAYEASLREKGDAPQRSTRTSAGCATPASTWACSTRWATMRSSRPGSASRDSRDGTNCGTWSCRSSKSFSRSP